MAKIDVEVTSIHFVDGADDLYYEGPDFESRVHGLAARHSVNCTRIVDEFDNTYATFEGCRRESLVALIRDYETDPGLAAELISQIED